MNNKALHQLQNRTFGQSKISHLNAYVDTNTSGVYSHGHAECCANLGAN